MPGLTIAKREVLAHALDRSGLGRMFLRGRGWNGLLVLNYHRIGEPGDSPFDWDLWSASQDEFEQQVRFLGRNFEIVGVDDLDEVLHKKGGRYVMITFDDGYRDNYEAAFPILKAYDAVATFFLSTGFLDSPRVAWWDEIAWMVRTSRTSGLAKNVWTVRGVPFDEPSRCTAIRCVLATYKLLRPHETERFLEFLGSATGSGRCPTHLGSSMWMTWDMVREMRSAGMCIGGHTVNHPVLSSLPPDEQNREVVGCTSRIAVELDQRPIAFSYPVGGKGAFDEETRACLMRHRYRWAFNYSGGYTRFKGFDAFDLPRAAVERDVSRPTFRAMTWLPQLFA